MHIRELSGKHASICILGFGKEGQAALRMLEKHASGSTISIADAATTLPTTHYPLLTGPDYLEQAAKASADFYIKSPGIPPHPLIDKWRMDGRLTTGTQLFLDSIAGTGATVIGVTGSKGKSTTSTLIYECLKAGGKRAFLIGNIGKPAIEYIDEATPQTIFVQELSSYQLMDLTTSPSVAVVTSFFPEHLDYHGSLEAYKEAKKHVARFQKAGDVVFYNGESAGAKEIAAEGKGEKIAFTAEESPVALAEIKLIGRHNLGNIAGAFKVAARFGVPVETCKKVFRTFVGLPHRLQSVGVHHGIEWIDDAISTTPDSAIAALDALGDRVATIILGGQDRGVDFAALGKRIAGSSVKTVILFPGSGPRIRKAIEAALGPPPIPNPFPPRGERGAAVALAQAKYVIPRGKMSMTLKERARNMRKNPTPAEQVLWEELRTNKLGVHFRRQHPVLGKILDFYCDEASLGIEVDGGIHESAEQSQRDRQGTTHLLAAKGIRLLRIQNEDVLRDVSNVITRIKQELRRPPLPVGEGLGEGALRRPQFFEAPSMKEAIALAKKHTMDGKICLLSTASPSYGMFKNFEEKGDMFQKSVQQS